MALVGAPNVGKSTLFNLLTGARATVGNWPGTTVEVARGVWRCGRFNGGNRSDASSRTSQAGAYSQANQASQANLASAVSRAGAVSQTDRSDAVSQAG
ncbi:MAG: 50S ribosome-binding GTPase, partial [Propionibacteriaceae bacterium]|nr:50S ribosome-binding GTPase [Propionibacteriaceae bacterium]